MNLLAKVAEAAGKKKFHLRMDVFYVVFEDEVSCFDFFEDGVEGFCKDVKFVFFKQTDRFKHLDVGL